MCVCVCVCVCVSVCLSVCLSLSEREKEILRVILIFFFSTVFMVQVVYQTSEVEVPVEKIVYQDRPVEVERIVYKEIEIPVVSLPPSQL
jgi:cbb3-type cytochrome oxidase subunit 1